MNTIIRVVVSLLAGIVGFAVVAVGVTAAFEPWIAFSLMIGLPVGLFAGLTALFATYVGLWYRDQSADGTVSRTGIGLFWAAAATVVDFVAVLALGVAVFFLVDASVGIGLLVAGLPVTLVLAAVAGYLLAGTRADGKSGSRSTTG